jgi:galactose-1-phosphate uridylyltransferase
VSELRFNELRGEEVVYATHRQERMVHPPPEECPLCPGSPELPVETFEVAVFENRFPAFSHPQGASEVVVYTDRHEGSFGELPAGRAEALMWVWRERYRELGARSDVEYVLIFENRGDEVGATLHHPHGQIYGYPYVPPVPAAERRADLRRAGAPRARWSSASVRRAIASSTRTARPSPSFPSPPAGPTSCTSCSPRTAPAWSTARRSSCATSPRRSRR